ncbi:MAG: zinc ribbon domain-containing protein [Oscillospiraceae bacterium]
MALIICPECNNQISDTAAACPHCGYSLLHSVKTEEQIKKTEIGELKKNTAAAITMIIVGTVFLIIGILGAIVVIGWPFIIVGFFLLVLGTSKVKGEHDVICPYCGTAGRITAAAENYKCNSCKKISVRNGNELKTVI